jgi:F0F1-type ATP synthase assembly protein I
MAEDNNKLLYQYAGFAMQLLAGLGLAAFIGWWIDKKIATSFHLLIWLLPLLVLLVMIWKVVRDTSKKRNQ